MGTVGSSTKNKINVIFVGLDGAGKTTILFNLRLKDKTLHFNSSSGFNCEHVTMRYHKKSFEFLLWDLAGEKNLRSMWFSFFDSLQPHAVVFVVDPSDETRFAEAKADFQRVYHHYSLANTLFLLAINQRKDSDGQNSQSHNIPSESRIREKLGVKANVKSLVVNSNNVDDLRTILYHICSQYEKDKDMNA